MLRYGLLFRNEETLPLPANLVTIRTDIPRQGDGGGVAEIASCVLEDDTLGIGKFHRGSLIPLDHLVGQLDGFIVPAQSVDLHLNCCIVRVLIGDKRQGVAEMIFVKGDRIRTGTASQIDIYRGDVLIQQLRLEGDSEGNFPASFQGEWLRFKPVVFYVCEPHSLIQRDIAALARQCGRVALEGDTAGLHLIEEAVEILHRFAGEGAVGEIGLLDSL